MSRMMIILLAILLVLPLSAHAAKLKSKSAAEKTSEKADKEMYKEISYANKGVKGPKLVVLDGDIKSSNVDFTQKIVPNNIADFAEIELQKAGFEVLERGDLGPLKDELKNAVELGDKNAAKKFKKGKFETTRWFLKFDILKAEPVAKAKKGFSGGALGNIISAATGNRGGAAAGAAVGSMESGEAAGVWLVGMRYKLIDAVTTEQISSNYFEEKMEMGAKSSSFLGVSSSEEQTTSLDTLAQRLVQFCVADIDATQKGVSPPAVPAVTEVPVVTNGENNSADASKDGKDKE